MDGLLKIITNKDALIALSIKFAQALLIVIIAIILLNICKRMIDRFFNKGKNAALKVDVKRAETLKTISHSIVKYAIYFVAFVTILKSVFNIDATTIVAAAGIGGLAVGFGAQSLVKDIITGFFILLEDQYAVGDAITVNGITGSVVEIGLRITKVRNAFGDISMIPNSEIKIVTNLSRGPKGFFVDIPLVIDEDIGNAISVLENMCSKIIINKIGLIEGPKVLGVNVLDKAGVFLRIQALAETGKQFDAERFIRIESIKVLKENNIKII